MSKIEGDLIVTGNISSVSLSVDSFGITNNDVGANAEIARTKLEQNTLQPYPIPLTAFHVWDAMQTNLPGTSATDDLGLITGTFGTGAVMIQTSDLKTAGSTTRYARVLREIAVEYDAAETAVLRIKCGMITHIADVTATVDIECYRMDDAGGIGSDLCATAAQSMNSLTFANKDFTLTTATLNPGDTLDIRIAVAVNDAASGTAVIAALSRIALLLDIRG